MPSKAFTLAHRPFLVFVGAMWTLSLLMVRLSSLEPTPTIVKHTSDMHFLCFGLLRIVYHLDDQDITVCPVFSAISLKACALL